MDIEEVPARDVVRGDVLAMPWRSPGLYSAAVQAIRRQRDDIQMTLRLAGCHRGETRTLEFTFSEPLMRFRDLTE